jgi:2-oxoglutarate dehydrogenase E2 component (dihydrolipoamide succinyltransferase)
MATTVTMPQLGETVTEGTILSWAKQAGDSIAEDEVLLEISTDKVDTEVPSPVAGTVLEILIPEGETVTVGTPLAVIGEAGEEAGSVGTAPAAAVSAPEPAPAPEAPSQEQLPSQEPATVPDDPEPPVVEPAAAAPAIPDAAPPAMPESTPDAPKRSVLSPVVRKLAADNGIDLAMVTGTGDGGRITRKDVSSYIDLQRSGATPPPPPASPTAEVTFEPAPAVTPGPAPAPTPAPAVTPGPAPTPAATPAPAPAPTPAPAAVSAESPQAPTEAEAAPVAAGADRVEEMPRLRKVIAENMLNAKRTAAHVWTAVEVDFESVETVRQRHKAGWKAREGYSLTYMPFIARATIDALGAYPVVNSSFDLENATQTFHSSVGLGIAVDLNEGGLVVMNMPGADALALTGLARGIRGVAEKARAGKLELDDLSGSTFTITNPGPFGSFMSAPIINVPNVAILSTDTVSKRPAVITMPDGSDAIAIRHIGYLGLTWDHRVFDGSTAVLFLRRIKENLETWDWDQELA